MPKEIEGDIVGKTSDDNILKKRGYQLGEVLGEGSYAKVYFAEYSDGKDNTEKKERLACKVINAKIASKKFLRRFFPRELEILSRVNHVNLVRVHSILQRKQKYFLFMQYCDNGDLFGFILSNGAIRERQARVWFCQILSGLHYLHERNIAHRDMKCENVLLTSSYNVKISDFGFARYVLPEDAKSQTWCGSITYAAPEIIKEIAYDPKAADIWSIGVILFVMLNKSMPFEDKSLRKMYQAQFSRKWRFRNKVRDLLTTEVKSFLYKTLEPDQDLRMTVVELWKEPWIQKGSNVDLDIRGTTGGGSDVKIWNEYKDTKEREKLGRRSSPDIQIQIMDADTAKSREITVFIKEYKEALKSENEAGPGKTSQDPSPSFLKFPASKSANDDADPEPK